MKLLNFSFPIKGQPYKSWKGKSSNGLVARTSRPNYNYVEGGSGILPSSANAPDSIQYPINNSENFSGPSFKARPIKHWRLQVNANQNSGNYKPKVGQMMDKPGGVINLPIKETNCPECGSSSKEYSHTNIKTIFNQDKFTNLFINKNDKFLDQCEDNVVCVACGASTNNFFSSIRSENNLIKQNEQTTSKKGQYLSSNQYLESKVKLYDQNININHLQNVDYYSNKGPYYVNNHNNVEKFEASNKIQKNNNYEKDGCFLSETKEIIYKPSNSNLPIEGSISSSTRTFNLKNNTITYNSSNFYTANQLKNNNFGENTSGSSNYFVKNKKINGCCPEGGFPFMRKRHSWWMNGGGGRQPLGGTGNHTINFLTNNSNIETNLYGTTQSRVRGAGDYYLKCCFS